MSNVGLCSSLAMVLVGVPLAVSATSPAPVAPGTSPQIQQIAEPCPAFSWTTVGGAAGHELQIFQLSGEGAQDTSEATLVRRVDLPAGISSWTPEPGQCLARGERFGWTVRARLADGTFSEWSRIRLFEVVDGPSVSDLEDDLGISRESESRASGQPSYFSSEMGGPPRPPSAAVSEPLPPRAIAKVLPQPVLTLDGAIQFPDGTRMSTSPVSETGLVSLRILGGVLKPRENDVSYTVNTSGGCAYVTAGDASTVWNTGVYLPNGVTVDTLRMYYYDTSASNTTAWFTVYDLYGSIVQEWSVSSSTSAGNSFNDSAQINHVIDHSVYNYAINWRPLVTGSTMQLCGFRIFYSRQ